MLPSRLVPPLDVVVLLGPLIGANEIFFPSRARFDPLDVAVDLRASSWRQECPLET